MGVSDYRAALHYLRTTPDGRIAFGIGGMQPNLARHIGPRFAYDEPALQVAVARPASHVPDVRRRADRGGMGRADRRRRARTCRSSARSSAARCTTAWATRATASAPPTWAAASWPCGRSADTTTCSTCRSSTPARCGSRPSRSAPRERSSRTTRSAARTSSRTAAKNRTRSWTSSRSCPRRLGYNLGP